MAALASPIDARTPPPADEGGSATPPADFAPHASLVARDWRGSLHVAGRTMLLDDVRPSASNRSVLARLTCDAELSPYVQIGAGQWRIDPVLFPSLPTHETLAGQIGAGFQIDAGGVQIAGEATWTILYREGGSVARDDVVAPILAVVVAAQTRF